MAIVYFYYVDATGTLALLGVQDMPHFTAPSPGQIIAYQQAPTNWNLSAFRAVNASARILHPPQRHIQEGFQATSPNQLDHNMMNAAPLFRTSTTFMQPPHIPPPQPHMPRPSQMPAAFQFPPYGQFPPNMPSNPTPDRSRSCATSPVSAVPPLPPEPDVGTVLAETMRHISVFGMVPDHPFQRRSAPRPFQPPPTRR